MHENPCIKTHIKKQNEICFIRLLNDQTNLSPEQNVLFYGPLIESGIKEHEHIDNEHGRIFVRVWK